MKTVHWELISGHAFYLQVVSVDDSTFTGLVDTSLSRIVILLHWWFVLEQPARIFIHFITFVFWWKMRYSVTLNGGINNNRTKITFFNRTSTK